jgi:hypothetical protein
MNANTVAQLRVLCHPVPGYSDAALAAAAAVTDRTVQGMSGGHGQPNSPSVTALRLVAWTKQSFMREFNCFAARAFVETNGGQ